MDAAHDLTPTASARPGRRGGLPPGARACVPRGDRRQRGRRRRDAAVRQASAALLSHAFTISMRRRCPTGSSSSSRNSERVIDYESLHAQILSWQASGVRLAIDDTGSGCSTPAPRHRAAARLPQARPQPGQRRSTATATRARARVVARGVRPSRSGTTVIAEGIERPEELELLRAARPSSSRQGYLLPDPGPAWPECTSPTRRTPRPSVDRQSQAHAPMSAPGS